MLCSQDVAVVPQYNLKAHGKQADLFEDETAADALAQQQAAKLFANPDSLNMLKTMMAQGCGTLSLAHAGCWHTLNLTLATAHMTVTYAIWRSLWGQQMKRASLPGPQALLTCKLWQT